MAPVAVRRKVLRVSSTVTVVVDDFAGMPVLLISDGVEQVAVGVEHVGGLIAQLRRAESVGRDAYARAMAE